MEEVKTEDKKYCVYMHVNKHNDKKYIGLTSQRPEWRWGTGGIEYIEQNEDGTYKQPAFAYALQKYNDWDRDWDHIIVAKELTKDEAIQLEIELISFYQTNICKWGTDAMGYNLTDGGEGASGYTHSEETKRKMSEKAKGREFPEALKERYSIIFSGDGNPFYGKHHTEETKRRLSEATKEQLATTGNPFFGKHHTDEAKRKISETRNKIPVVQIGIDGEFIAEYDSAHEACRITGVSHWNILNCCYGYCKSAGGFMWVCKTNYNANQTYTYQDNNKKPVVQLDLSGKLIAEHISVSEASRKINGNNSCIYRACTSASHMAYGFLWIFKTDYDPFVTYTYMGSQNCVSVVCLDIDGNYICEYNSIADAHNATGADCGAIIRCCKGKQKTSRGFRWKYKEEWKEMQNAV